MKKILTISAILLGSFSGFSQASDIEVDWGPLSQTKDTHFGDMIGTDGDAFYTFGIEARGGLFAISLSGSYTAHIKKYDRSTFKEEYDVILDDFEYKGENAYYKTSWISEGEVHLFFETYHRDSDRKILLKRIIDARGRISKPEEISYIPAERRSDGEFTVSRSRDSTKILVYANYPYEKKESDKFGLLAFDTDYNLLWEEIVTIPYTDKYFSLRDHLITNNGDVFVLGYAEPDRSKGQRRKRKSSNEDYKIFKISAADQQLTEFDLGLEKKFLNNVTIKGDMGNDLLAVAGFYSNRRAGETIGSFYITLEQNNFDLVTSNTKAFSKNFMKNFMSERKAEKGRGLYNFEFGNFIRRTDGGAILVAERDFITTHTYTDANGRTTTTTRYHNHDIIVLNISPQGNIEWITHIPKYQTSSDGGFFSSYALWIENHSDLHFIFNDNRKNLERLREKRDLKGMGNPKKSVAIIASIDPEGKLTRKELFSNRDLSAILVPKEAVQTLDDALIIFGLKKKKVRFGSMSFR